MDFEQHSDGLRGALTAGDLAEARRLLDSARDEVQEGDDELKELALFAAWIAVAADDEEAALEAFNEAAEHGLMGWDVDDFGPLRAWIEDHDELLDVLGEGFASTF